MRTIVQTDVVIIGGGSAGVAAAVGAAEKGLQVVLVEKHSFLGGKATAAEVGTICGLYKFSKNKNSEYIVKGFAKKFAEELRKKSNTSPLQNFSGLHYLPYDIAAFKNSCARLLQKNNVTVYLNATIKSIQCADENIDSIIIQSLDEKIEIKAKSFIDGTGDSIVSRLADMRIIESDHYQAAAQIFTLQDINETDEARLGMILIKALKTGIEENKIEAHFDRVYIVQGSLKNNAVSLKIGIPLTVTNTSENLIALKDAAYLFIEKLTAYLTQHVAAFSNATIAHIAAEVGVRVGIRTAGKYILTEQDVLSCTKFDDAIANASWPIEEWEQDKRVKMRYFKQEDFYQIPARCLQSNSIKNLFIAGRNISATDSAIASARVMGICLQTGYAAGVLAAANAQNSCEKETIKSIQNAQL